MEQFAKVLDEISKVSSKKLKQAYLMGYFTKLSLNDVVIVSNILLNNYKTNVGPKQIKVENGQTSLFSTGDLSIEEFWGIIDKLTHSRVDNLTVINELYCRSSIVGQKYINKILLNNINVGISIAIVLDSLGEVFNIEGIRRQYYICGDVHTILTRQYKGIEPFTPIFPMLAKTRDEIPRYSVYEPKLDGMRMLFHKKGNDWKIYSRLREDISSKEIVNGNDIFDRLSYDSIILDGESISDDMIFQNAMKDSTLHHIVFFDILYLNGESLVDTPFAERRTILEEIAATSGIEIVKQYGCSLNEAFEDSINSGFEGLVIKDINEPYMPNERKWIKMKKATDTADLLVIGAEYGDGKRAGLYGSFILGALFDDKVTEICKVGSGFSDDELRRLHRLLYPYEVKCDAIYFQGSSDVVFEVVYQDVTISPSYDCGISLRFPVFKSIRTDKGRNDIESVEVLKRKVR
jgi:DNA ligase-1